MDELIFWGILASLAYTELTGISPGGIIVPAYFTLYAGDPWRMALTLGLALVSMGVVRLLSRFMILFGRRRYAVYLLVGMLLKALLALLFGSGFLGLPNLSLSIGYLVPGLLGREAEKQGILRTFASLGIVVCVLRLLQLALLG